MRTMKVPQAKRFRSPSDIAAEVARYAIMLALAFVFIMPFVWMLSTSLKELNKVFAFPPDWIPKPVVWQNYIRIWQVAPFGRYFLNSIVMTAGIMIGQILLSFTAAYAFARIKFRGSSVLFLIYLGTMMVPAQTRIIPLYLLVLNMGILDTYAALILPAIFNAFAVFLLRQFFLTVPRDMDEAAIIDGANHWNILTRIMVPLSKPVLSALSVFIFLQGWNALLWPLIATSSARMRVLAVGLTSFSDIYGTDWPLLMTGSILVVLPTLIVYLVNQQFITRGIVMSGLKN